MERTYSDSSPTSSNVPQFVCASVRSAGSSRPCRPSTSARIAVATTSWKLSCAALRSIESTYALSILLRMISCSCGVFGAVLGRVDDVAHDLLAPLGQGGTRPARRARRRTRRRARGPARSARAAVAGTWPAEAWLREGARFAGRPRRRRLRRRNGARARERSAAPTVVLEALLERLVQIEKRLARSQRVHRLTAVLTYAKSETELVKTGSDMSSSLIAFSSAALSSISSMRFFSSVMYGPRNGS